MRRVTERIRGSYAAKLLVAFGLIAVLLGGFTVAAAGSTSSLAQDRAQTQAVADAERRALALERWSDGVERRAAQLATAPAITSGDTDAVADRLAAVGDTLGEGVAAVHYVSDGEIAASTADGATLPDAAVAAADGSTATYTDGFQSPTVDGLAVAYVHPTAEGALVYTLAPNAVVDGAVGSAGEDGARSATESYLVDDDRTVVATTDADVPLATPDAGVSSASVPALDGAVTAAAGGDGTAGAVAVDGFDIGESGGADGESDGADGESDGASTDDGSAAAGDGRALVSYAGVGGTPWAVVVQTDAETAFAVGDHATSAVVGVALLALVSLVLFGSTVGSTTVIQTRDLQNRANRVADGELDLPFPTRRTDEFGDVRQSMDQMRRTLTEEIETAERAEREAETARREAEELSQTVTERAASYATELEAAAAGDLTRRVATESDDTDFETDGAEAMHRVGVAVNELLAEYEETIRELSAFADDVTAAADDVSDAVGEATTVSERLSERLTEIEGDATTQRDEVASLADEIDRLSATAEEIAATTDEVAEASETAASAAREGADAAEAAIDEMDETVATIDETVAAVDELAGRVDRVTEVVDLISDVADETDMLAINASIEAARAGGDGSGVDGDGFAVVAEEVKALAGEAKESAAEVNEQLTAIREQTETAVDRADDADETLASAAETVEDALTQLSDIVDHVERTDDSVAEISRATAEQAESTQAASEVVDDVRAISERTAADADDLVGAADDQRRVIGTAADTTDRLADDAERLSASLAELTVRDDEGTATGASPRPATTDD